MFDPTPELYTLENDPLRFRAYTGGGVDLDGNEVVDEGEFPTLEEAKAFLEEARP